MQATIDTAVELTKSFRSLICWLTFPNINLEPIEPTALKEIIRPITAGSIARSVPNKGKKITIKSSVEDTAKEMKTADEISRLLSIDFAAAQVLLCSLAAATVGKVFRQENVGIRAKVANAIAK